jgi:predicted nucleotidyltransferase
MMFELMKVLMSEDMQARITEIQAKYANELMKKANVVGVGIGLAKNGGKYSSDMALVVMVEKKVPLETLDEADRIPSEIEGVRVDVQETGAFTAGG